MINFNNFMLIFFILACGLILKMGVEERDRKAEIKTYTCEVEDYPVINYKVNMCTMGKTEDRCLLEVMREMCAND